MTRCLRKPTMRIPIIYLALIFFLPSSEAFALQRTSIAQHLDTSSYKCHAGELRPTKMRTKARFQLRMTSTSSSPQSLPAAESMKASDLRKELQSYGISTKSFFEKSELVEAVVKARAEGKTPIKTSTGAASADSSSSADASSSSSSTSASSSSSSSSSTASREEKIASEMQKCKTMKVKELKKELESMGVSTKSFFEKSEFVKALAEARVDGVKKSNRTTGGRKQEQEEEYDPSYRDVVMQKMNFDPRDMRFGGGAIIDVRLNK